MAKKKRISNSLMAALVLLPVAGISLWFFYDSGSQKSKVAPSPLIDETNGADLDVRVTNDGQPVKRALVAVLFRSERRRVLSRITNDEGQVRFGALPAGKATLVVRLKGYAQVKRELTLKAKSKQEVELKLERRDRESRPETAASADDSEGDPCVAT